MDRIFSSSTSNLEIDRILIPPSPIETCLWYPLPEERIYGSVNTYGEEDSFDSPFAGRVVVTELLPVE